MVPIAIKYWLDAIEGLEAMYIYKAMADLEGLLLALHPPPPLEPPTSLVIKVVLKYIVP